MKRKKIEKMIKRRFLSLGVKDWLHHFYIPIFFFSVLLFIIYDIIKHYLTHKFDDFEYLEKIPFAFFIFVILGLIVTIFQRSKLRLKEFKAKITDEQFNRALMETIKKEKWNIVDNYNSYVKIFTDKDGEGELGGDMITIIKTKNGILINSIEYIWMDSSFFQKKRNRYNIRAYLQNLDDILTKDKTSV